MGAAVGTVRFGRSGCANGNFGSRVHTSRCVSMIKRLCAVASPAANWAIRVLRVQIIFSLPSVCSGSTHLGFNPIDRRAGSDIKVRTGAPGTIAGRLRERHGAQMLPRGVEYPNSVRSGHPDIPAFVRLQSVRSTGVVALYFTKDSAVPVRAVALDLKYPYIALIRIGNE